MKKLSTSMGEKHEEKKYISQSDLDNIRDYATTVHIDKNLQKEVYIELVGLHVKLKEVLDPTVTVKVCAHKESLMSPLSMQVCFKEDPAICEVSSIMHTLRTIYVDHLEGLDQSVQEILLDVQLEEGDSEKHHVIHFEERAPLHESFLMNLTEYRTQAIKIVEELYEEILKYYEEENVKIEVNPQQKLQFYITAPALPEELKKICFDTDETIRQIQRAWDDQTERCKHADIRKALKNNVEIVCLST